MKQRPPIANLEWEPRKQQKHGSIFVFARRPAKLTAQLIHLLRLPCCIWKQLHYLPPKPLLNTHLGHIFLQTTTSNSCRLYATSPLTSFRHLEQQGKQHSFPTYCPWDGTRKNRKQTMFVNSSKAQQSIFWRQGKAQSNWKTQHCPRKTRA